MALIYIASLPKGRSLSSNREEPLKRALQIFGLSVLFASSPLFATDLDVCATCTYTTISSAVTAAADYDIIRIATGNLLQNLRLP